MAEKSSSNLNAAIAAAVILAGFALFAYFLPTIMLAAGEISPYLAGAVAALFIFAFFGIFWLRGRRRRRDPGRD